MPPDHIWGRNWDFADSNITEFKEIRKEWKAKKKEEEAQRKADEERQRQADPRGGEQHDQQPYGQMRTPLGPPPSMGGPQLPPIGYPPQQGGAPSQPQYGQPQPSPGMDSMGQYVSRPPLDHCTCANIPIATRSLHTLQAARSTNSVVSPPQSPNSRSS